MTVFSHSLADGGVLMEKFKAEYVDVFESVDRSGYYAGMQIALRVSVDVGHAPTDAERKIVEEHASALRVALVQHAVENCPSVTMGRDACIAQLLGLFPSFVSHAVLENDYWPRGRVEYVVSRATSPWLRVLTSKGHIIVGWRKRVIVVDWSASCIEETAQALFPAEEVTKSGKMIHAWGLDKAREYLKVLMGVDPALAYYAPGP